MLDYDAAEEAMAVSPNPQSVTWLAQALHEINVLDLTGNPIKAQALINDLNAQLQGSHLLCTWHNDTKEWVLIDNLLYSREE